MAKCKTCGAEIVWIKTGGGKNMPCDARLIKYKEDPLGPNYLVTASGKLVRCRYLGTEGIPDGLGRIPHWATCPNASQHRRGK